MAYVADSLALRSGAPGSLTYYHDASTENEDDSMATVFTAGYFNNTDDNLNLTEDDLIFSQCSDGDFWHKVSAISSGSVTTQMVSSEGPWNGDFSTGAATPTIPMGVNEMGTGTCTSYLTPTPYPGAKLTIHQSGTSTASVINVSTSGVTFNEKGDTSFIIGATSGSVSLLGISITGWAIVGSDAVTLS